MRLAVALMIPMLAGCAELTEATARVGDVLGVPAPEPAPDAAPGAEAAPPPIVVAAPLAVEEPEPSRPPRSGAERAIASLGDPAQPGLWLETPLVTAERPGRVVVVSTGSSQRLTLRPSTSGTRLSLDAMRALGAPLTDLIEIDVFGSG